jgi:DNA-binding transcriptional ArsR family regulator
MDVVFQALAHPVRRQMLDLVRSSPGARVGQVCERFEMSRIGAMKHLNILEAAGLIISRQDGRNRLLYVNAVPIQMIYDRWISDWSSLWAHELATIKYRAEASAAASESTGQHERTHSND